MTEITERVVKEALLKQRARTMATIYLTEMYCKWRPLRYLSVFKYEFSRKIEQWNSKSPFCRTFAYTGRI